MAGGNTKVDKLAYWCATIFCLLCFVIYLNNAEIQRFIVFSIVPHCFCIHQMMRVVSTFQFKAVAERMSSSWTPSTLLATVCILVVITTSLQCLPTPQYPVLVQTFLFESWVLEKWVSHLPMANLLLHSTGLSGVPEDNWKSHSPLWSFAHYNLHMHWWKVRQFLQIPGLFSVVFPLFLTL